MLQRRKRTEGVPGSDGVSVSEKFANAPLTSAPAATLPPSVPSRPLKQPTAKLGQILVGEGVISERQLQEALNHRTKNGGFLGQALMDLNILDQATLTTFLVKQCKIPHLSLADYTIDASMAAIAPKELCEKFGMLPLDKMGKILTVAMVDPLDKDAMDAISAAVPDLQIKPIHCDWRDFDRAFTTLFPNARPQVATNEVSVSDFDLPSAASLTSKAKASAKRAEAEALPEAPVPVPSPVKARVERYEDVQNSRDDVQPASPSFTESQQVDELISRVNTLIDRLEGRALEVPCRFAVAPVSLGEAKPVLPSHEGFDTFIAGVSNESTRKFAAKFAEDANRLGGSLLIEGAPSTGKTHLAAAVLRSMLGNGKELRGGYISCARWASESEGDGVSELDSWDVLVVDDVHRLSGHAEAQCALAVELSRLHAANGVSIITTIDAGDAFADFDPQLASLLHGGMIARLSAPDISVRLAVAKQFVERKRLALGDDALELAAGATPGDLRRLLAAVLQIAVTAELRNCPADRALVDEVVKSLRPKKFDTTYLRVIRPGM